MKTPFRFFIIIMAAAVFVGCGGPFSLSGDGIMSVTDNVRGDSIIPVPSRWEYNLNDVFNKEQDLSVYLNHTGGTLTRVPIGQVTVAVAGEPVDSTYLFKSGGEKDITINYADMSTYYTVKVNDPYGLGGDGDGGSGDGGGSGIIIIGP